MKAEDDDMMTKPDVRPHLAPGTLCLPGEPSSPEGATFSYYLLAKGLARATVATYERSVDGLRSWMEAEGIDVQDLSYQDLATLRK